MALTLDRSDTKRALAHLPSGDEYIVEYCSVWDDQECVGSRIIRALGPVIRRDLDIEGPLEPSTELFDLIDEVEGLTEDDAEWLQNQEDIGNLSYPIGVR